MDFHRRSFRTVWIYITSYLLNSLLPGRHLDERRVKSPFPSRVSITERFLSESPAFQTCWRQILFFQFLSLQWVCRQGSSFPQTWENTERIRVNIQQDGEWGTREQWQSSLETEEQVTKEQSLCVSTSKNRSTSVFLNCRDNGIVTKYSVISPYIRPV